VFPANSKGGMSAIAAVLDVYVTERKQNPNENTLPVVALGRDSYNHPDFGHIDVPLFERVGWEKVTVSTPPVSEPGKTSAVNPYADIKGRIVPPATPAKLPTRDDLDDEIPFD